MQNLPFAAFDFFAYLIPGALCLFSWDYVFHRGEISAQLERHDASLWVGIGVLLISYLVGQVLAGPANALTSFPQKTLRRLAVETTHGPWWTFELSPLPDPVRNQLWERAQLDGKFDASASTAWMTLYYRAVASFVSSPTPSPTISGLANVAAFCQYTSIALIFSGIILIGGAVLDKSSSAVEPAVLFVILGTFLFWRFMRAQYRYIVRLYLFYLKSIPCAYEHSSSSACSLGGSSNAF